MPLNQECYHYLPGRISSRREFHNLQTPCSYTIEKKDSMILRTEKANSPSPAPRTRNTGYLFRLSDPRRKIAALPDVSTTSFPFFHHVVCLHSCLYWHWDLHQYPVPLPFRYSQEHLQLLELAPPWWLSVAGHQLRLACS